MTLIPWSNVEVLSWDATCYDTLAPFHIDQTCKKGGSAAEKAAKKTHNFTRTSPHFKITTSSHLQ